MLKQRAQKEVALLHRAKGAVHLDRVHAAREVAVPKDLGRLDPVGRLAHEHLEEQVVGLLVNDAAHRQLELRVREQQRRGLRLVEEERLLREELRARRRTAVA